MSRTLLNSNNLDLSLPSMVIYHPIKLVKFTNQKFFFFLSLTPLNSIIIIVIFKIFLF